jgi:hypothetical protein
MLYLQGSDQDQGQTRRRRGKTKFKKCYRLISAGIIIIFFFFSRAVRHCHSNGTFTSRCLFHAACRCTFIGIIISCSRVTNHCFSLNTIIDALPAIGQGIVTPTSSTPQAG